MPLFWKLSHRGEATSLESFFDEEVFRTLENDRPANRGRKHG